MVLKLEVKVFGKGQCLLVYSSMFKDMVYDNEVDMPQKMS